MSIFKKMWQKYMQGAKANNFPVIKFGLFGRKLKSPKTLREAVDALDVLFSAEIKIYVENWSEGKFIARTHHNIGQKIRNDWGLWNNSKLCQWFNKRGIKHPDDMSGIILTTYYRCKHDLPVKLEEQIEHYVFYWNTLQP